MPLLPSKRLRTLPGTLQTNLLQDWLKLTTLTPKRTKKSSMAKKGVTTMKTMMKKVEMKVVKKTMARTTATRVKSRNGHLRRTFVHLMVRTDSSEPERLFVASTLRLKSRTS